MRTPLLSFVAIAVVALALPAIASAAPTSTQITSPGSPTFVEFNPDNPRSLHVEGSTSGGGGNVDLRCYTGATSKLIAGNVAVSDGLFATDVQLTGGLYLTLTYPGRYCVLRAVPAGMTPAAAPGVVSEWQGPEVGFGQFVNHTIGAGHDPNPADTQRDYYIGQPQTAAFNDYDSVSSCGFCDTYLYSPGSFAVQNPIWWGNATVYNEITGPAASTRSGLQVDGVDAYAADGARRDGLLSSSGFPAVSLTHEIDPATGDLTIHETSPFATCSPQPAVYPPTATSCASFSKSVVLHRTIRQDHEGSQVAIVDKWSSDDGQPHQLDVFYADSVRDENFATLGHESRWKFDWIGGGFASYPVGTQIAAAGSAGHSVFVKSDGSTGVAGDGENPIGALTYGQEPAEWIMRQPVTQGENIGYWEQRYTRSLPASGEVTIAHVYSHAFALAEVQTLAAEAATAVTAPTVSISSPEDGSTVAAATTHVTGNAGSADGQPSVKVNGVDAVVAGDGSWSADVPLAEGSNQITATASNRLGITAAASRSVTRPAAPVEQPAATGTPEATPSPLASTPATVKKCRVPKLAGKTLRTAKLRLKRANCRVGKVTRKASKRVRPGRVIASKPGAKRVRKAGTRIALTVAKKR